MTLTDSHCHLDSERFAADREAVIQRARDAGVHRFLAIGTGEGPPDLETAIRLAENRPGVWATVGIHPHDAAKAETATTFSLLDALAEHPKVVAIGEIGLDYHYDFAPRPVQASVFRRQLAIARGRLPVIIHTREAWADTLSLLQEEWRGGPGVMHCFTGDTAQAREALDFGFLLGFGGVITFPKSDAIREAARFTPADRILVETDAPFLAPVPHRGKRNEPAFVVDTLRALAALRGISPEALAEVTESNFDRLFPCPQRYTGESHA